MCQIETFVKNNLYRDKLKHSGKITAMETPRSYLEAILHRTAELRKRAGLTQEEMAERLGITRNTYMNYERATQTRMTMMPIHLAEKFCEITGATLQYFLTGREHPVVAAYNALEGQERVIVDKFLGLPAHNPLDDTPMAGLGSGHPLSTLKPRE